MHTKKPKLNIIIWEKGYNKQYSDTNYHNLDKNTLDKHLQLSIEFSGGGNDGISNCSFKINLKQFMNFYRLKNFQELKKFIEKKLYLDFYFPRKCERKVIKPPEDTLERSLQQLKVS